MALVLRYMKLSDVYQVSDIEKRTFADSWSTQSFIYEVSESTYSYMVVLEDQQQSVPPQESDVPPLHQLIQTLDTTTTNPILGYGGLWNIADESHISNVASHPDYRGKGYGELLLAGMVAKSIHLNASYIVLEVRVGNKVAQQLYQKYGFTIEDVRKKYYRDQEDAYDMRLDLEDMAIVENFQRLWGEIQSSLQVDDQFTTSPHPRTNR